MTYLCFKLDTLGKLGVIWLCRLFLGLSNYIDVVEQHCLVVVSTATAVAQALHGLSMAS